MKKIIGLTAIVMTVLLCMTSGGHTQDQEVYVIDVSDAISPGIADYIVSGIEAANDEKAACIVIRLNTPGGLADAMRTIVMEILASEVPVVVFVAPSGARAASAGVMITIAADVAAMAPGTNIGAAHPVGIGGTKIDKTMSDKVVNDMVAHVKSVAEKRGRNAEWAEKAVRESVSATESEALKLNVIDIVAKDLDDLLRQINGRKIADKGVLVLDSVQKKVVEEGLRTKILKTISDPNIAYILLMIGLAGLYFELSHPGAILPGVVGGVALILALYSLQALPVNFAGLLLIFLALVFFIMELKITSYGLLSVAGIVSFLLGSIMLFDSGMPQFRVSWRVILPTLTLVSVFFVAVATIAFKAQVLKPQTGADGLSGKIGVVKQTIDPEGKVLVHGELWKARAAKTFEVGDSVRVTKVEGLVLEVDAAEKKEQV